jgi:hypothetical protein
MGRLGVIDSLCAGFNIRADTVVIAGWEGLQIVESVDGDGVFGSIEADGGSVASNLAFGDIVGSLGAEKEAVATKNSVSDEGRSLLTIKLRERK